ncbi:hypothetical protein [Prosthecobacter sp.]|uniref:Y-family DNA polymerase n=1 Tax=Prosthecobacter sp. TaxID=1965333 RepID=UPI0037C7CF67
MQTSIDESYLDLHGAKQTEADETDAKLQQAIGQSLKLSVSVGLGGNKLVSKIASSCENRSASSRYAGEKSSFVPLRQK